MAAFYVHDVGDTDTTYEEMIPGCSRVLKQNGCSNTVCNPLDATLTTPYRVPAVVSPPASTTCVQFNGCPVDYPVVFCVTHNQDHSDDQNWGVVPLFWDFINRLSPAAPPCPVGQGYENGVCAPCASGEAICNNVCVDEQTDSNNCGSCGAACILGAICSGGVCAPCPAGDAACFDVCVNTQTDPLNCGACGNLCFPDAGRTPACVGGVCTLN